MLKQIYKYLIKNKTGLFTLISFCLMILSCNRNPLDIKLTNKKPEIEVVNIDEKLCVFETKHITNSHLQLINELGDIYLNELSFNLRIPNDSIKPEDIKLFYQSDFLKELEKEKSLILNDALNQIEKSKIGFQYLTFYFPQLILPQKIGLMNTLFSGVTSNDSILIISTENYLNPTFQIIPKEINQWQKKRMNIKYMSRDILQFWIQAKVINSIEGNIAENLIQAGKILYLLKACFPNEDDTFILRYPDEDYNWAIENETMFWEYLVREEILFKNSQRDLINFFNEGPYTIGLSEESPDRMGQFLGYQMVLSFMKKNSDISLEKLMKTEYNAVLQAYEIN